MGFLTTETRSPSSALLPFFGRGFSTLTSLLEDLGDTVDSIDIGRDPGTRINKRLAQYTVTCHMSDLSGTCNIRAARACF